MKKGDKHAQFYLIASVILVMIIVGVVSITNYSTKKQISYIQNYGDEFEIESEKVIDYDVLNNQNRLEEFTNEYSSYLGARADMYFIKGNENNIEAYKYTNGIKTDLTSHLAITSEKINFEIEETLYEFNLNKGQNFYFIISKEIDGEKHVYTN